MATINKHPVRFELTAVYRHPEAKADIVLVHGLNGAPDKTWTASNGVYWPTDLLPASLKDQHADVLVYGYNADVYGAFWERPAKHPSDNFIHHHAQTLVTTLTHYRKSEGTERRPIIWVAHSLGGIVTKRALLYSDDVRDPRQEDLRSIVVSTYGIIFLGTPHGGANAAAWSGMIQRMADVVVPRKIFESESVLLKSLRKDSETLEQINSHFLDIYQKFRIHMAHENHKTDVKGTKILVVDAASASPQLPGVTYYGIEATHSDMCKFDSDQAPGYRTVSTAIREWIADAPNVIPVRWQVEDAQRRVRANLENFERARLYQGSAPSSAAPQQTIDSASTLTSTSTATPTPTPQPPPALPPLETTTTTPGDTQPPPPEPLFIHPETFRPNSYFVGREDELRGLHEMLMDRRRRADGTSAVLVRCLPGGGKTHLAREYVFRHRADYPGGVYWLRAKSRPELEYWFWRIARTEVLLRSSASGDAGVVREGGEEEKELRDPRKIVHMVRAWLSARSEWLLVLDGVQFDIPGLREFIPDAKNSSLIYTSTERAVTGDPRFDNPQVMELGLLTAQQAQDLLLLELEKKQPWSADDRAMAAELVQLMGRLPLMIHVAAQHMKATREPLARYLKSYRSRPKAGDLPAYKAVREQLANRGEYPALNLMSLLAFFDQHLPVEMLTLGLSALDKITPVKTCDAMHRKASLNNTLKVLIAFALVERTEGDDISPTSSRSSKRSFDRQVENLDLLHVHSVVQAFFIDSIHEEHQIHFWLERAVAVWSRSYDEADRRIQEDPRVGLPDDYRRLCIHGQKLLQNINRFEKRYPSLARARSQLEERLGKIQGQIDDLSHTIQKNIVDRSVEEHPASVFDRVSASSQSDAPTLESHSSQLSGMGPFEGEDSSELVQSPVAVAELLQQEGQAELPYPSTTVMPTGPETSENDDQETVVPSILGTQIHTRATEFADAVRLPSDLPGNDRVQATPYNDWQEAIPHHRVIARQESRRYHHRVGSWRDKTISDPQVGLNDEAVMGFISTRRDSSRSPLRARLTAQSEAAMERNKIKLATPPSRHSRGSSGSQTSSRPKMPLGKNSWALPQTQKAPDTEVAEVPPEAFSSGLAQIWSSPKSWTEAIIKKLRKTVLPPGKPTASPTLQPQLPPDGELVVPPAPIFRGTRSANSSPANNTSPFPPPSFSAIPTEELMPTPGLPLVVRRWNTVVYRPDGTPITSSGVEWASTPDPLSLSYPALPPSSHHHPLPPHAAGAADIRPAPLLLHDGPAADYSSQPMSRDGSHRSAPSISIHSPLAPRSPSPSPTDDATTAPKHATLPIPTPAARLYPAGGGSPFPRTRPPASYTETEPSPRLDPPFFADVETSYSYRRSGQHRDYDQHHDQHHDHDYEREHGRGQEQDLAGLVGAGATASSFPPAAGAGASSSASASSGASPFARWRPRSRGARVLRGLSGGRGRRAQSASPSGGGGGGGDGASSNTAITPTSSSSSNIRWRSGPPL
ncbi:1af3a6ee-40fd-4363-852d-8a8be1b037e7 [Thermothielavioides terrestris]|uniref:1af3a6ee-40fd-4363-852d-8a8be1b037e7 n=1 Tax=Thermothielavioides terrestris TaxID=2587410 RepID=A0A446BQ85_9PEZI|nr:1af3a6ee-40fd-4363-852d-8a8be1b037e7 [Thermothielavioides terrestris]